MKNTLALSAAVAATLGLTILNGPARASVVIDISPVGADTVVATGSGTIDLTGLTYLGTLQPKNGSWPV
jgi:hypothetical protein